MFKDYEYVLDKNYNTADLGQGIKAFIATYYAHSSVEAFEILLNIPSQDIEKNIDIYFPTEPRSGRYIKYFITKPEAQNDAY